MRRQESGTPVFHSPVSQCWADRDETGKVLVFRPQAIVDPGSHARPNKVVAAGMQLQQRPPVCRIGSVDGVQEADIVNTFGKMGEELTDEHPVFSIRFEFPGGLEQCAGIGKLDTRLVKRKFLAVIRSQLGLVIERVQVGRAPFHEEENDPFRTCREVRIAGGEGVG